MKIPHIDATPVADHPEALYCASREAECLPDLASIDEAAIERFAASGYLAVQRAFDPGVIEDAMRAIDGLIAGENPAFNDVMYEAAASKVDLASLDGVGLASLVRKLMAFCRFDERLERIVNDPAMLAVVERLIGQPPKCFQEMALLKPPGGGREKPWHQDHAYFDLPMGTPIVGVWIALDRAGLDNGCMHLVEATHHEPVPHFMVRDWQVCDTHLDGKPIIAVPLPPGGALLFSGLLLHGTPTNHSASRRRALQFHYVGHDAQTVDVQQRLAVFGGEGLGVEC